MSTSATVIKVGISACLLGNPVRFNGGHKESRLCSETLARHFQFVPICPEVAIGLGTPREPIRLVGDPDHPRAVGTVHPELDVSDALNAYGERIATELDDVSGYILMQKSPSCGMERVKVYQANGHPVDGGGSGLFAKSLMRMRPDLPVEEAGRLNDPVLRENFLTRVFAHAEWRRLLRTGLTRKALVDFHSRYKYQLMASDPQQYKALGRMVARVGTTPLEAFAPAYFSQLMAALKKAASRGNHSNVLQHLSGYLKRHLEGEDKQELQRLITQYREGIVPLVVPLTLLKHHFRRHPDRYVANQAYLQPHPEDLSLRNGI
ncbi:2-thiouracil desulfurase family protein [Pseudomonas stutzeri]|uniref:YbgA family protein n=1 Tax=Stutzerimonas stutzeri TaxID=316 RepID=UPI00210C2B85|nr:2-thiouracil desulfurase family protein [Stutzerimonas stutzeri]MCQ4308486.1 2-thiouracil desulfurase family protein [Stutzerimonas stutzeri]